MAERDPSAGSGQEVKPFLAHLEDLRITLIRSVLALAAGMLLAVPLTPWILGLLKAPLRVVSDNPDQFLRSLEVGGAFSVSLQIVFWTGLLFSTPFIAVFAAGFVFPGLTRKERGAVKSVAGMAVGLFALGVFLGYRMTLPAALSLLFGLHKWLGISAEWTVTSYVAFSTQLLLGFGLVFELPAILLLLGRLGIVTSAQLAGLRRHAVVAALIIGMILTPPDIVSQLLMAVPLMVLYEVCIWLIRLSERRRDAPGPSES